MTEGGSGRPARAAARVPGTAGRNAPRGFRRAAWAAAVVYMAIIFCLSAQSNPLPELTRRVWDKGLHCIEYGGLGLLLGVALRWSGVDLRRALVLAVALGSLYAASDELHQGFVPGRSADVLDWAADTVGAALGALAAGRAARWPPGA